jgi:hypothetical protein
MPTSRTSRAPRARARKAHPLDNLIREALRDAVLRDEALHGKLPELRETEASPRPAAPTAPRPLKECLVRLRLPASKLAGVDGTAGRITAAATFRLLDDGRVEWKVTALYRAQAASRCPTTWPAGSSATWLTSAGCRGPMPGGAHRGCGRGSSTARRWLAGCCGSASPSRRPAPEPAGAPACTPGQTLGH